MAVTLSPLLQTLIPLRVSASPQPPRPAAASVALPGRRLLLSSLAAAAVIGVGMRERECRASEIGLFGIRKGLKKAEEAAEEIVKEGFEAADKGIEAAEKGIVAAEKEIVAAEKTIIAAEEEATEVAASFSPVVQAGAVAGVEVLGVLVATAVVNGILGPEPKKS